MAEARRRASRPTRTTTPRCAGWSSWASPVTGIDALTERLRSAGVPVVVAPFNDDARGFHGGIVRAPDGNRIGLYGSGLLGSANQAYRRKQGSWSRP